MTTRSIYLLSGWKTSGKDTFFRDFQKDNLWKWKIFRRTGIPVLKTIPITRMAFADLLKQEVKTRLDIPDLVELDRIKEDPIFDFIKDIWMNKMDIIFSTEGGPPIRKVLTDVPLLGQFILSLLKDSLSEYYSQHEMTSDFLRSVTIRDILKGHASMRRDKDPNYYAQHVLNDILSKPDDDFMITDLRFSNELSAAYGYLYKRDIFTVRVFRKAVSVPPPHDFSEHDLDSLESDYLVIPIKNWEEEYKAVNARFGFYRNYVTQDEDNTDSSMLWTDRLSSEDIKEEVLSVVPNTTEDIKEEDIVPNTTEDIKEEDIVPNTTEDIKEEVLSVVPNTTEDIVKEEVLSVVPNTTEDIVKEVLSVIPSTTEDIKEEVLSVIPSTTEESIVDTLINTSAIPSIIIPTISHIIPVKLKEPIDIIDIITPGIIPGIVPSIRRRPNFNILDSIKTINIISDIDT